MSQIARETDSGLKQVQKEVAVLVADGTVARVLSGNQTIYATRALKPTWAWLLEQAATKENPSLVNPPGRRGNGGPRAVKEITTADLKAMRSAVRRVVDGFAGRSLSKEEYSEWAEKPCHHLLTWDPAGGAASRGDWSLALELLEGAGGNHKSMGALRKLLDLAATQGWIVKADRHDPDYTPFPVEWASIAEQWVEAMKNRGRGSVSMVTSILEGVVRGGWDHPKDVDWAEWIGEMEAWFRGIKMHSQTRSGIRGTYNRLCEKGLIQGPKWDGTKTQMLGRRPRLLTDTEGFEIGDVYCRNSAAWDGEGPDPLVWVWPRHDELKGLIEGDYGLRMAVVCMTAPAKLISALKLPSKEMFPRERIRGKNGRTGLRWRRDTVKTNLMDLTWVLRDFGEFHKIDWSQPGNDLSVVMDVEKWEPLRVQYARKPQPTSLERGLTVLGRLASPILEGMAVDNDDEALADRCANLSAYVSGANGFKSPGRKRPDPSWTDALKSDEREDPDKDRRESIKCEAAWTAGAGDEFAICQMERIGDAFLKAFEGRHGELGEQIARVRAGDVQTRPGGDLVWAKALQKLLLWKEQCVVPLRSSLLARTSVKNRPPLGVKREVQAVFSPEEMKGDKEFAPRYGNGVLADLHELYTMPGGGLETILGRAARPTDPFWPGAGGERPKQKVYTRWMKKTVKRFQGALLHGVTYQSLREAGVLRQKFFRHGVAKRLVMIGQTKFASVILSHSTTRMVEQTYGVVTARDFTATQALALFKQHQANEQAQGAA